MRLAEFHKMRRAVQTNARPGEPQEVEPLAERLRGLLETAGFTAVEAGRTDDPDHLVVALCHFAGPHGSDQVAEVLEALWQDHLRYGFWEAHAMLVDNDQVELLGATRADLTGHYATVHVVAQRASVPAQRPPIK